MWKTEFCEHPHADQLRPLADSVEPRNKTGEFVGTHGGKFLYLRTSGRPAAYDDFIVCLHHEHSASIPNPFTVEAAALSKQPRRLTKYVGNVVAPGTVEGVN
jgi:hypothetical protein